MDASKRDESLAQTKAKDPHRTSTYDLPTSNEKTPGTAPSRMKADEVRGKESFMLFGIGIGSRFVWSVEGFYPIFMTVL